MRGMYRSMHAVHVREIDRSVAVDLLHDHDDFHIVCVTYADNSDGSTSVCGVRFPISLAMLIESFAS